MPFKMFCLVFSLLLCPGCGRGNSTLYRASFYLPSETLTLAEQNRHDLLASTQLESGILYKTPTETLADEASEQESSETEADTVDNAETLPDDVSPAVKKK